MVRISYYTLILLTACGSESCGLLFNFPRPAHKCTSTQGAILVNDTDCVGFQAAVTRADTEVGAVLPEVHKRWATCSVFISTMSDGGTFEIYTYGPDAGYQKVRVAGYSNCGNQIFLATPDWHRSAFSHEVAHMGQCPKIEYQHETWVDGGIEAAVERAQ